MTTKSLQTLTCAFAVSLPMALTGCGGAENDASPPPVAPPQNAQGPMGGRPGGGPATSIKGVMRSVAAGPNSLTPKIGEALKGDTPDWLAIQAETKEYAALARALGTYEPPKGTKESWKTLSDSFAETASDLDKAAQAKDLAAARTAHDSLAHSCSACHREHQKKGSGGFGGPGGPGGGPPRGGPGGPGGGPPPGGPGAGGPPQG